MHDMHACHDRHAGDASVSSAWLRSEVDVWVEYTTSTLKRIEALEGPIMSTWVSYSALRGEQPLLTAQVWKSGGDFNLLRVLLRSGRNGLSLSHVSSGAVFLVVRLMGINNLERLNAQKESRHRGEPITLLDEAELLNL